MLGRVLGPLALLAVAFTVALALVERFPWAAAVVLVLLLVRWLVAPTRRL